MPISAAAQPGRGRGPRHRAVALRDARGGAAGRFNIAVNPIAGRPGYSFWNIRDITARTKWRR